MITVTRTDNGQGARVTGAASDCALFFCFWQDSLWPGWIQHDFSDEDNTALPQWEDVAVRLRECGSLSLSHGAEEFRKACIVAIEKCRQLGIEVDERTP